MLGTYRFKESVSSLSSDHYVCFHPFLQYLRDYSTFSATARYWTEAFAKNSSTGMEEKVLLLRSTHIYCSSGYTEVVDTVVKYSILQSQVQKLVEMGFPEDMVRSVLKSVNGDENMALEKLCSGWGPISRYEL